VDRGRQPRCRQQPCDSRAVLRLRDAHRERWARCDRDGRDRTSRSNHHGSRYAQNVRLRSGALGAPTAVGQGHGADRRDRLGPRGGPAQVARGGLRRSSDEAGRFVGAIERAATAKRRRGIGGWADRSIAERRSNTAAARAALLALLAPRVLTLALLPSALPSLRARPRSLLVG